MGDDFIPKIDPNKEAGGIEDNKKKVSNVDSNASNGDNFSVPNLSKEHNGLPEEVENKPDMNRISLKGKSDSKKMKKDGENFFRRLSRKKKIFLGVGTFLLIFILINSILIANLALKGKAMVKDAKELQESLKSQDLNLVEAKIDDFSVSFDKTHKAFKPVSWMRVIPFLGIYVSDAGHAFNAGDHGIKAGRIVLKTMTPYADLVGFSGGEKATDGEKTAADRIDFIVKTLPDILPQMDKISEEMKIVDEEIGNIEPKRYPKKLLGKDVRDNVELAVSLTDEATKFVVDGKPLLEQAPYILGIDSPRTYLVLFQNDKELRPTGGFLTAYSIMTVDKAKFEPVDSNDIYNLDARYSPSIKAPDPIIDYIKGPYVISKNLRLRDMNWDPDFSQSMETFTNEVDKVGLKDIDGIIAVDTQLLVNLLDVLGPTGVSGFGNFSTEIVPECNCPQVIYELESFADVEGPIVWDPNTGEVVYRPPNSDNRKRIIGPLMNAIMANTLGQPKEKMPNLFEAAFKSMTEKHILFYLKESDAQKAVESFGIAGSLDNFEGDYLHINDANLGGRKSNLYVTQEVVQDININSDKSVEKTVVITYKNPEEHDGWLNSVLPNWVRIYVPRGSELMSFEGVEDRQDPYEEAGKTVYAGYFELSPQGVAKVTLKYKLPFKVKDKYNLFVQKQPGKDSPLYTINIGKIQEEGFLKTDKEYSFPL